MRISKLSHAFAAPIALAVLAACSTGAPQISPIASQSADGSIQRAGFQNRRISDFLAIQPGVAPDHGGARRSFMDPQAVGRPLIFASDNADGDVSIYLQHGRNKLVGQIPGPIGFDLATDAANNLYSANVTLSSNSVTIYAPPYTMGPKLTLTGRTYSPIAVSRQGTVAVYGCTIPSGTNCGGGFLFYAAGSTTPCATLPVDTSAYPNGIFGAAFDRNGKLYFDSAGSGAGAPLAVGTIDGGCSAKKVETLMTANTVPYAGGIKVDHAGRIAILAASGTSPYQVVIYAYDTSKHGSLGNPVSTTPLPGSISTVSGTFAFQASGRGFWAGYNDVGPSYTPGASEFIYPAGGSPEKTVLGTPGALTYGVAVTPALVP